jgi:hypothetical protein
MGKFKKGDRVRARCDMFDGLRLKGDIGIVCDEKPPHQTRHKGLWIRWDRDNGWGHIASYGKENIELIKKEAKPMKKERKKYPSKFFVQRCMTNDDPNDLRANVTPDAVELDMDYPMLEITSTKKGFKIREVEVGISMLRDNYIDLQRTVTVKEVK